MAGSPKEWLLLLPAPTYVHPQLKGLRGREEFHIMGHDSGSSTRVLIRLSYGSGEKAHSGILLGAMSSHRAQVTLLHVLLQAASRELCKTINMAVRSRLSAHPSCHISGRCGDIPTTWGTSSLEARDRGHSEPVILLMGGRAGQGAGDVR